MIDIWPLVDGFIGAILGSVAVIGQSYLRKKGENLATKEDIAAITHEIEQVRLQYADQLENISQENRLLLEQTKQKHQLSLAALEQRLEAHQQAYALWWGLATAAHDETGWEHVHKCQDWWVKHCLYLDAEARQAFRLAYHAAADHKSFKDAREVDLIKENWKKIIDAGEAIVKAVNLPSLGKEYEPVEVVKEGT